MNKKRLLSFGMIFAAVVFLSNDPSAAGDSSKQEKRKESLENLQKRFDWWPTDAKPAPVQDTDRGGYWWWPDTPGQTRPWGNRGYIYVYKIIYDYQAPEEEEAVQPLLPQPVKSEPKPSLLIKKILKNIKIYFDYNKADLRPDHTSILENAVKVLQRNPQASILITGNCDVRGSAEYNLKLGKARGEAVRQFMWNEGIEEGRVKIISRGKLDAVAPVQDLVGMQRDRNAQFMIAEVEEVLMTDPEAIKGYEAQELEEGRYLIEKEETVETQIQVTTKEYVVQKNDSLWKIAQRELGSGHRWKYLYELNKDRIKNPDKLKAGTTIIIPVE